MKPCSGPLVGEPPTGEPDAGDPPVRFGGRGVTIQCDVPTPITWQLPHQAQGPK